MMTVLGMDGMAFLASEDPAERILLVAVARRAAKHRRQMDTNLAREIAAAVGRLFG